MRGGVHHGERVGQAQVRVACPAVRVARVFALVGGEQGGGRDGGVGALVADIERDASGGPGRGEGGVDGERVEDHGVAGGQRQGYPTGIVGGQADRVGQGAAGGARDGPQAVVVGAGHDAQWAGVGGHVVQGDPGGEGVDRALDVSVVLVRFGGPRTRAGHRQAQEAAGLGPHLAAEEIGHHRGERRVVGELVLGLAAVSGGAQLLDAGLAGP